jgi:glycosyltransferase involved in cell wall biosynthesis
MSSQELTSTSRPDVVRGDPCVVVAIGEGGDPGVCCLESVLAHTPAEVPIVAVLGAVVEPESALRGLLDGRSTRRSLWLTHARDERSSSGEDAMSAAFNHALALLQPADVAALVEPCTVTAGWLGRLRDAVYADTNTATASALADAGTALALSDEDRPAVDPAELAASVSEHTLALHPRLSQAVGPCIYVRRDALELVGLLDAQLELRRGLEVDFAQRCLLSGLAHVAADDVVVGFLARTRREGVEELPSRLHERYPYLSRSAERSHSGAVAASSVLPRALEAARRPRPRLSVTVDARALDGEVTGTHVHILELIRALAQTGALRLRLLVRMTRIDRETLELLRGLPESEILAAEDVDPATPRSAVFHRPQQTFSPGDVALALELGERFVLSQLDLIAYRNPGYFADADSWEDYRRASRHGLSAAERVVVFSDHTRRELLSDALVEQERIRIVPPGLDHRAPAEPRRPSGLDDSHGSSSATGFLLCLGTDFRHKNRVFALRLLAALREHHDWNGSLVLAGTHIPHGSSLELERAFLEEHRELSPDVVQLGPASEQEKVWLIAHAAAVVYPSVYEGFGLVPFESALRGVPCVFAPQSSLADTAPHGTATILPWDPETSATAIHSLLIDSHARTRHVNALATAARGQTWAAAGGAMVAIYREAAVAPVRDAGTLSRDAVQRERRLSVVHEAEARQLVAEREHAQAMYDTLNAEVGFGLSLIGPHGALPEGLQRALLGLAARPRLSGPLFGTLSRMFLAARAVGRVVRGRRRPL